MRSFRAILIGIPLCIAGLFCIFSIWLVPVGIILLVLSGVPLAHAQYASVMKNIEAGGGVHTRSKDPHEDEPIPEWVIELEKNDHIGNVIPMPITGNEKGRRSGIPKE